MCRSETASAAGHGQVTAARKAWAVTVFAFSLGLAATPTAGEGLLRAASSGVSAEKRLSLEADPYVMRWRVARIDSGAAFSATAASEPLAFRLFDDVHLRAQVRRARTLESGSTFLYGTVEGGGHFTLLRHQSGVVVGELQSTLGTYVLSPGTEAGRVLVQQRDVSRLPGCGVGSESLGRRTAVAHGGPGIGPPKTDRRLQMVGGVPHCRCPLRAAPNRSTF